MRRFRRILAWTSEAERQRLHEQIQAWQEEERAAARERIIGVARVLDKPLNAQPTTPPERPLLTPGQAAHTRQAGR